MTQIATDINRMPILTKIIEKIIIRKCPELKEHNNNQFGFASDASTIHTEPSTAQ